MHLPGVGRVWRIEALCIASQRTKARGDWHMRDHHQRRPRLDRRKVRLQPGELLLIEFTSKDLVVFDANGIQHHKMPALIVKGVVQLAEVILVELFTVLRVAWLDRASLVDPGYVMIAYSVVNLACQLPFCLTIEREERVGFAQTLFADVEQMIATGDAEIGFGAVNLI